MKLIRFVDVGEGITEGHIQKWLVKDGDAVKEDQAVVQVETDKAVVNAPAPISGTIKINKKEGTTVYVGETVAWIGTPEELAGIGSQPQAEAKPAEAQAQKPQAAPAVQQAQAPAPQGQRPREPMATPAVRKMARDMNIDLAAVVGTGPGGRILESDLKGARTQQAGAAATGTSKPAAASMPVNRFAELEERHRGQVEREPMSQLRKVIAKNMEESWKIPRAVHMDMINAGPLYNIVSMQKENVLKSFGIKLTFLPFIIKAVVEALKENQHFNASFDRDSNEIVVKKFYNIGLAAEAKDGLKVVVVKDADKKSIVDIARDVASLHKKILDNTITIDEMRDATFTITNVGSLGGGYLSVPMINPPEVAILAIHSIKDAPMVADGKVVVGKQLPFSISFDHRVLDGADAVKFGLAVIRCLQDPDFLERF